MNLFLVILGGGLGAGGRYLLGGWLHSQLSGGFPWGTFAVNALGSLLIGLVFGLAQRGSLPPRHHPFSGRWRPRRLHDVLGVQLRDHAPPGKRQRGRLSPERGRPVHRRPSRRLPRFRRHPQPRLTGPASRKSPGGALPQGDVQGHHYGEADHQGHGGYIGAAAFGLRDQLLGHHEDHGPGGEG